LFLSDAYRVSCEALLQPSSIAADWMELESRADNPFFLSWAWINAWLCTYSPKADLIKVWKDTLLVGMGILVRQETTRFGVLRSRVLHLHQTGVPEQDQIWIEYNSLLTDSRHHPQALAAACDYLVKVYPDWDELVVGAITEEDALLLQTTSGLFRHDLWQAPTYDVDLNALRKNSHAYLDTLSRNTRYQINRSLRRYQEQGPVVLQMPDCRAEAISWFGEIAPLHRIRWGSEPGQSGFANPDFVSFHEALIEQNWDSGRIGIIRIAAGERIIAYFYNFIFRKRVYFYLSGLVAEADASLKPGMLGHALCIQHYLENKLDYYDFMGGGERYKASLADPHRILFKMTLQKKLLKFRLERTGRNVKHRMGGMGRPLFR
jgi:CelD/BcsL family acetyltransferase involved in cellulose biosynthesis